MIDKVVSTIEKVVASGVLIDGLFLLANSGAGSDEIDSAEKMVGHELSSDYKAFLNRWNGADLDVIRLYGCGNVDESLKSIESQSYLIEEFPDFILFGSSPAGFMYLESTLDQKVYVMDAMSSDAPVNICHSFSEFVVEYVFGERSNEFGGDEWKDELLDAGVL